MRSKSSVFFSKLLGLIVLLLILQSVISFADSVSTKTYRELTAIQELMSSSEDQTGNLKSAINRLEILLDNVSEESLDEALTLQTLGYALMADEQFAEAIIQLRKSLETKKLPQNVTFNVGYMVAQLYAALGEFDNAMIFAKEWFAELETPNPNQYIFMANIYAQVKRYQESVPYAETAIKNSDKPRETWYQLLTANYFELRRFPDAAKVLLEVIELWPEKTGYWEQLASVYMMMDNPSYALASLKVAFANDLIEKETTIKSLFQLALIKEIPDHAARLIEKAMSNGLLNRDEVYLDLVAQAWVSARELNNAVETYSELSEIVDHGEPLRKMANLQINSSQWQEAENNLQEALSRKLEKPGETWLLLGIAQSELGKFDSARTSLRKARAYESVERSASSWLRYSQDMKRQADWISNNR